MAGGRKASRHRPRRPHPPRTRAALAATATAALALAWGRGGLRALPRLSRGDASTSSDRATCRATCDRRLRAAALERHAPPSPPVVPPAPATLFLRRDRRPPLRHHAAPPAAAPSAPPPPAARPRRLPALIKLLVGEDAGDDVAAGDGGRPSPKPLLAKLGPRLPRGDAARQPAQGDDAAAVQRAAAAAAAAVLSPYARAFGGHRMRRVDAEWDAALRWIAGWEHPPEDAPPPLPPPPPPRAPGRGAGAPPGSAPARDGDPPGYDALVGDLARMLESCIARCEAGADSDLPPGDDDDVAGGAAAARPASRAGTVVGWIAGPVLPRPATALGRGASAALCCALLTLLGRAALSALLRRHADGHAAARGAPPAWLLAHEEELAARRAHHHKPSPTARTRQKKKKRKKGRTTARDGRAPGRPPARGGAAAVPESAVAETRAEARAAPPMAEITVVLSRESAGDSQASAADSLPSVLSSPGTSAVSSPSLDGDDPAATRVPPLPPSRRVRWRATGPSHASPRPVFAVPTREERDEADRRLRDFQHAQIQRLMLRRRRSGGRSPSSPSLTAPGTVAAGGAPASEGPPRPVGDAPVVALPTRVLRPPPGFAPALAEDDAEFLADNELFLARLLDDDDDEEEEVEEEVVGGGARPALASSLDPAAAPFVAAGHGGEAAASREKPRWKDEDAWPRGPIALGEGGGTPLRVGGVYGGSVWSFAE